METFIVVVALMGAGGGGLILLSCLSGKRAQLVKAYNIQQGLDPNEPDSDENSLPQDDPSADPSPATSDNAPVPG